jgi:hypothetical protein
MRNRLAGFLAAFLPDVTSERSFRATDMDQPFGGTPLVRSRPKSGSVREVSAYSTV